MPFSLMLAMQAAGMVTDWLGTSNQQKLGDMGARIQQVGIENNIEQTRLETEDASLQAMRTLRQNLGTQAAVFAARGTRTGAGSALSYVTQSIGNFNEDERMRRMNLMGRVSSLSGQGTISKLNQQGENTKLWQGFASRTINRFSTDPEAWKKGFSSFGLTESGT